MVFALMSLRQVMGGGGEHLINDDGIESHVPLPLSSLPDCRHQRMPRRTSIVSF